MKAIIPLVLVLSLVSTPAALAEGRPPRRGGPPLYDPKTVETVRGEVTEVTQAADRRGHSPGMHVKLGTSAGTLSVRLGPARYLEEHGMRIAAHDQLEVRGSRVTVAGETFIIAGRVKKGEQTLELRDERGIPLWRRAGARP